MDEPPQPPQAEQRHLAEILDYRHRLGVPEYLVRWRGEDLSGASWVVEEMLLTAAKDMVDSFQQQRAQMRREGKQRMEQPGSPQGVGSGAIDASDLEADVLDDQTTSAEQPLRNLSKRDAASGQVVSACAWDLSPSDLAELSAISDGWLSRFDAFFRPRLSQKHISILMRNICRLAQAEGADFGPPLGCYMQGRHLSLASDLRSLRRELSTACNGDFKKADSRTGGWKFSHPLCKLAEFQVRELSRLRGELNEDAPPVSPLRPSKRATALAHPVGYKNVIPSEPYKRLSARQAALARNAARNAKIAPRRESSVAAVPGTCADSHDRTTSSPRQGAPKRSEECYPKRSANKRGRASETQMDELSKASRDDKPIRRGVSHNSEKGSRATETGSNRKTRLRGQRSKFQNRAMHSVPAARQGRAGDRKPPTRRSDATGRRPSRSPADRAGDNRRSGQSSARGAPMTAPVAASSSSGRDSIRGSGDVHSRNTSSNVGVECEDISAVGASRRMRRAGELPASMASAPHEICASCARAFPPGADGKTANATLRCSSSGVGLCRRCAQLLLDGLGGADTAGKGGGCDDGHNTRLDAVLWRLGLHVEEEQVFIQSNTSSKVPSKRDAPASSAVMDAARSAGAVDSTEGGSQGPEENASAPAATDEPEHSNTSEPSDSRICNASMDIVADRMKAHANQVFRNTAPQSTEAGSVASSINPVASASTHVRDKPCSTLGNASTVMPIGATTCKSGTSEVLDGRGGAGVYSFGADGELTGSLAHCANVDASASSGGGINAEGVDPADEHTAKKRGALGAPDAGVTIDVRGTSDGKRASAPQHPAGPRTAAPRRSRSLIANKILRSERTTEHAIRQAVTDLIRKVEENVRPPPPAPLPPAPVPPAPVPIVPAPLIPGLPVVVPATPAIVELNVVIPPGAPPGSKLGVRVGESTFGFIVPEHWKAGEVRRVAVPAAAVQAARQFALQEQQRREAEEMRMKAEREVAQAAEEARVKAERMAKIAETKRLQMLRKVERQRNKLLQEERRRRMQALRNDAEVRAVLEKVCREVIKTGERERAEEAKRRKVEVQAAAKRMQALRNDAEVRAVLEKVCREVIKTGERERAEEAKRRKVEVQAAAKLAAQREKLKARELKAEARKAQMERARREKAEERVRQAQAREANMLARNHRVQGQDGEAKFQGGHHPGRASSPSNLLEALWPTSHAGIAAGHAKGCQCATAAPCHSAPSQWPAGQNFSMQPSQEEMQRRSWGEVATFAPQHYVKSADPALLGPLGEARSHTFSQGLQNHITHEQRDFLLGTHAHCGKAVTNGCHAFTPGIDQSYGSAHLAGNPVCQLGCTMVSFQTQTALSYPMLQSGMPLQVTNGALPLQVTNGAPFSARATNEKTGSYGDITRLPAGIKKRKQGQYPKVILKFKGKELL